MNNWEHFEQKYGPAIGRGAQCRVYGDGEAAVKVLSEGHVLLDVLRESYSLAFAESAGIPTSNLLGICKEEGHIVIRMRRVSGVELMETIIERLQAGDLTTAQRHLETFVDMQVDMHAAQADELSSTLAFYRKRVADSRLAGSDESFRTSLLAYMDDLPEGDSFCHNDYHPRNVLYDGRDYVVIDWDAAGKGDAAGDVAHSYTAILLTNKELADAYLELYLAKTGMERERVMRWMPMHAMILYGVLEGDLREVLRPLFADVLQA